MRESGIQQIREMSDSDLKDLKREVEKELNERKKIKEKKISTLEDLMKDIDENGKTVKYQYKGNTREEIESEITSKLFWKLKDMCENTVLECNGHYFEIIINEFEDLYKICIKKCKKPEIIKV